jgi:glycosyltransferase involved in cell wall biosynthesis
VKQAAATVALTARDAERLRALAGDGGAVNHVPAPFPPALEPAARSLPGSPAVVRFGSDGWAPNRDQIRWFVEAWPAVQAALPLAVLHAFGGRPRLPAGAVAHAAPTDSREVFAPGAVLVVPLRVASGVRMKILEAWARGVPVVATPEAAAGLEALDGGELLLFRDAAELTAALRRLASEPALARALVAAGRAALRSRHDPATIASRLASVYRRVAAERQR